MSGEQNQPEESRALPGVVAALGELGPATVITEKGMAALFGRHPASIRRAVTRGELPRPARLLGGPAWTVGSIVRHIETRLEEAAKEAERESRKISQLRP